MTALATVICPVDRSEVSRRALQLAVALASRHGARLVVLEVLESVLPPMADGSVVFELQSEARASIEEELNWFVAPLLNKDVPTEVRLRDGSTVAEIVREAETATAPIIVMGTHGRGGFERLMLGSVAEKVVRKAPCPVLAVPPQEGAGNVNPDFRRIVCAVDFSEPSASALAHAALVGTATSANLSLLHVLEWPFGETTGPDPVTTLRENLEAEARDQLDRLVVAQHARIAERVVRRGKPGREIVAFARERSADLIVLGASGKGALNQAILGSTAHHVLRDAPCPVLTVP